VPGLGEDGGEQAGKGICGPPAAVLAAGIGRHVAADEREDRGEGDEAGIGAGQGGGAGGCGGRHVVDEQQRPCFLAGELGGLAAQGAAGAADGSLQVQERDFHLPSFGVQGGDLPGRVRLVVQQRGQDPDQRGLRLAAAGARGDGEGDQPGRGAREPRGMGEYRLAYERAARELAQTDAVIRDLDSLRVDLGISKAELARRASRNASSVRRLFTASQVRPEFPLIAALADALGADLRVVRRTGTRPAVRDGSAKARAAAIS